MAGRAITLSDNVILAVAKRQDVIRSFPFFAKALRVKKAGCRCRTSATVRPAELTNIKATVANLTHDRLQKLKKILRVGSIAVHVRQNGRLNRVVV
jgi:hypothetical protein